MKYYLPVLFFSLCLFNCGRDNSKTKDIPLKDDFALAERTCDWCKSELPDNAFCYYDEVRFSSRSGGGMYDLDSIYLDRSPLPKYYIISGNEKEWRNQHPFIATKYSLSTLLLQAKIFGVGYHDARGVSSLQPFPVYQLCSIKCVKSFNESVKFSKPLNSKFMFTNNDN
jgi:hypothetical protein